MCLDVSSQKSQREFRKKIRENGGKITCWKVLNRHYGLSLKSIYYPVDYNAGITRSNRYSKKFDGNLICEGIHVYTTRKEALFKQKMNPPFIGSVSSRKVVPVTCYLKDFVAYSDKNKEAVFMSVELTKRNYRKAIK